MMPARLFALSFIAIIVLGNIWMGQAAFGGTVSDWVPVAFMCLMIAAFVFGIVMTGCKLFQHFSKPSEPLS